MNRTKKSLQQVVDRGNWINKLILILVALLICWLGYALWYDRQNPRIRDISLSELAITSPTRLCPGEMLLTNFNLDIKGEGVIIRDTSIQQATPLNTIIFSEMLRAPVIGPISENIRVAWQVPSSYFDYRTGNMTELGAGDYFQIVAVSSTGRNALSEVKSIEFRVKTQEECK